MKKWFVLAILLLAVPCFGADLTLKWDAVTGATGYKVYQSTDGGTTFTLVADVGNVLQRAITGVAEDRMVLYRVSAYNTVGEAIRYEAGAWFDFRKKPPANPGGAGIQ